jgi:uncharacterized protein (DUF433 family)
MEILMRKTGKTSGLSPSVMPDTLIRKPEGLFIAGTRITLYDVMDYLLGGWPPHLIRQELDLTETQIAEVMEYIDVNRTQCVAEYHEVLQQADENRQYWERRNRDRLAQAVASHPKAGREALWEKLQAWKTRLQQGC